MAQVSVLMNCRNSAKYLKEAIDSVFAQAFEDWEIVFYDNLSTDESPQIAKSYGPKLKYYRGEKPLSLGEARNEALKHCTGEYIAFLDCDDLWLPEKLERQMAAFNAHPEVTFAHCSYLGFDATGATWRIGSNESFVGQPFQKYLCNYPIGIATVIMKSSLLKNMSEWFDPALSLVEDYDFFMRVLYNERIFYDGQPLVKYRVHDTNLSRVLKDHWSAEFQRVYDKFVRDFPGFETQYAKEAKEMRGNIAYLQARTYIYAGNTSAARRVLRESRFTSTKYFLSHLATYLPARIWRLLYENRGRLTNLTKMLKYRLKRS